MSEEEIGKLKRFMGLFYEWFEAKPHHPPDIHPVMVMEQLERKSLSQARRGLEMAINDIVEATSGWDQEVIALADTRFLQNGAPSLSEVRIKYSRKYLQILKRGNIRSQREYYLVKGILDGSGLEDRSDEAKKVAVMVADYESRLPPSSGQ